MHLYTFVQVLGLVVLWIVKSSPIALSFPFFVVAMVPLRMSLKYLFSQKELEAVSTYSVRFLKCIVHYICIL